MFSAVYPIADIAHRSLHVRFVPISDIAGSLAPEEKTTRKLFNSNLLIVVSVLRTKFRPPLRPPKPCYAGL